MKTCSPFLESLAQYHCPADYLILPPLSKLVRLCHFQNTNTRAGGESPTAETEVLTEWGPARNNPLPLFSKLGFSRAVHRLLWLFPCTRWFLGCASVFFFLLTDEWFIFVTTTAILNWAEHWAGSLRRYFVVFHFIVSILQTTLLLFRFGRALLHLYKCWMWNLNEGEA